MSQKIPSEILTIVTKAVEDNRNSIEDALEQAKKNVKNSPAYRELLDLLFEYTIRDLVYESRHKLNVKLKNEVQAYQKTSYRKPATDSVEVIRAYSSVYDFYIGGRTLGSLTGVELLPLAEQERQTGQGYEFRARLLEWANAQGVPPDKTVRQAIPERKLAAAFQKIKDGLVSEKTG